MNKYRINAFKNGRDAFRNVTMAGNNDDFKIICI